MKKKLSMSERSKALALFADLMNDNERDQWIENGMPVTDAELRSTLGGAGELQDEEWDEITKDW